MILFHDTDLIETRPLTRFRSIFSLRNGIYSPIERAKLSYPDSDIYFFHENHTFKQLIAQLEGGFPHVENEDSTLTPDRYSQTIHSTHLSPFNTLKNISYQIDQDLKLYADGFPRVHNHGPYHVIGNKNDVYVHQDAEILPGVVLDTRNGPIVIDSGTTLSPSVYINGSTYIGKQCRIDNARITGGCIIGHHVRLGGEIENSIINDYSNKHHTGFLGHSVVGSWVNLGASTNTSDLKNNYGEIRIQLPDSFQPIEHQALKSVPTGRIKFGAIIGDFSKTAIGTFLNTGTVIDAGCNIFDHTGQKYYYPFSWGASNRYIISKFLIDCHRMTKRRNLAPPKEIEDLAHFFSENLKSGSPSNHQ
ncbi:MAG: glucose-1-phosphate thymidylyltransferase [Bacteroidota bacterium]